MALSGEMSDAIKTSGYKFFIKWSAVQSVADNTSTVTVQWGVRKVSADSTDYNSGAKLTCITGSTTHFNGIPKNWNGNNGWDLRKKAVGYEYVYQAATVTVAHANDGTGSLYIYGQFNASNGLGHITWPTVTLEQTVSLDTIPRASEIGATDANIGAVSMVTVTRKSAAYSHSIRYAFGALTGYLTAAGGVSASEVKFDSASVAFAVPASFYGQIPAAKRGTCTLTCTTYAGAAQIGAPKSCTFTATAAESACAPTVSGTVTDTNDVTTALTGDPNRLVRYFSTALCTITATARNGASIASRSIAGTAVSGTSRSIAGVETGSFAFSAGDSRGYTAAVTVQKSMVDYVRLTCDGTVSRQSPTGSVATLTLSGNYFNASFGAADNTLAVRYALGGAEAVAVTPVLSGNAWKASVTLRDVAYTSAYPITVTASDRLMTVTRTVTLNKGVPVFDWGESSFRVNVPLGLTGGLDATAKAALRDFIYPVGCYYWSSSATSPATLFGGTWEQVRDRFVLAAGGTYSAGATGGAASVSSGGSSAANTGATALSAAQLPVISGGFGAAVPMYHADYASGVISGATLSNRHGKDAPSLSSYNTGDVYGYSIRFGGNQGHTHTMAHTHSVSTMPPYIVAYCWRRTA